MRQQRVGTEAANDPFLHAAAERSAVDVAWSSALAELPPEFEAAAYGENAGGQVIEICRARKWFDLYWVHCAIVFWALVTVALRFW